jgi:hypothetical protein
MAASAAAAAGTSGAGLWGGELGGGSGSSSGGGGGGYPFEDKNNALDVLAAAAAAGGVAVSCWASAEVAAGLGAALSVAVADSVGVANSKKAGVARDEWKDLGSHLGSGSGGDKRGVGGESGGRKLLRLDVRGVLENLRVSDPPTLRALSAASPGALKSVITEEALAEEKEHAALPLVALEVNQCVLGWL